MTDLEPCPEIIQGGMGAGVSDWRLARTVSKQGQIGVVSGTALDSILARRLQIGDEEGNIRRALSNFPWPDMSQRVLDASYIPKGKAADEPFKPIPMPKLRMTRDSIERLIVANFVEVYLAKEGHNGLVGINYLEKIQLPTLPSLLGVMLAGVDFVLMGGGLPLSIPGILDRLSRLEPVELNIHVEDNSHGCSYTQHFDPKAYGSEPFPPLTRPKFLAIISSEIAAKMFMRRANGHVDGFVVEDHTAGGHNAPPRKTDKHRGESPLHFSEKDIPNIEKIRDLGRPFWLAGGCASPKGLSTALALGAKGIQVGTAFAYCRESAIRPEIKQEVLHRHLNDTLKVITDFQASPTGYPFKLIHLGDSITGSNGDGERRRLCDLGYLRHLYAIDESKIGYRCPAEPVKSYLRKGGCHDLTTGKQCLCNGLLSTIGLGQVRKGILEPPMVTSGDDFSFVTPIADASTLDYSAKDVIDYLKG